MFRYRWYVEDYLGNRVAETRTKWGAKRYIKSKGIVYATIGRIK